MPAPAAPFPPPPPVRDAPFPALYLYPLNDSWQPKHIALSSLHTKIGRQTSSKTAPGEKNGFFDSKVLSRQHAEVWADNGKIYIKDVKSSNGTFINGERLSSEGTESEPFELKSDDIVEFGIDIVGEDNKTIIHHKVAARVVCVFSEQDAQIAARAEQHQQQIQLQQQQQQQAIAAQQGGLAQPGPSAINAGAQNFPFASAQRRAQLAQQGLGSLGPLGGLRQPGKTGLSFDVVLSRLQGELQKSRETGAELNSLTSAMNDIQDTLGGNAPTNPNLFPQRLPQVRPPQENPPPSTSPPPPPPAPAVDAAAFLDIQTQLRDTQSSLASHLDKVRALEGALAEQEAIKQQVKDLRDHYFKDHHRDSHEEPQHHFGQSEEPRGGFDSEEEEHESEDDDDDARSIATLVPHELESVEEENEAQLAEAARLDEAAANELPRHEEPANDAAAEDEERRREDLGVGRPRTPEPSRLGQHLPSALLSAPRRSSLSPPLSQLASDEPNAPEDVYEQVAKLAKTVNTVLAVTASLEAQHSAAQSTIQALESKVQSLESMLQAAEDALAKSRAPPPEPTTSSLTDLMSEWKRSVEGQWSNVQEEWHQERERLNRAREEWETKFKHVDSGLEKIQSSVASVQQQQSQLQAQLTAVSSSSQFHHHPLLNGEALKHNGGLVTPPSPRSQSSDSARYRRRRRRASRSQSPSRSRSRDRMSTDMESEQDEHMGSGGAGGGGGVEKEDGIAATATGVAKGLASPASSRTPSERDRTSSSMPDGCLPTPALTASLGSLPAEESLPESTSTTVSKEVDAPGMDVAKSRSFDRPTINVQTALGVVILSVAAAAVLWKVKPE